MGSALTRRALREQLEHLETADRSALCQLWSDTYQTQPPKGWSRPMLRRTLAAELQGRALGTLTKAERHQLRAALPGAPRPSGTKEVGRGLTASPARKLTAGTRLVREWHGKTYEVTVLEGGRASMGDRTYRSLSAVATAITGTRWSGPLFFGLRNRKCLADRAEVFSP